MMQTLYWSYLTYFEAEQALAENAVAILPVGAIEPHGPHLPLNTDIIIAEGMARRAVKILNDKGIRTFILPTIPFTVTEYAKGFAGAISISPETAHLYFEHVLRSLLHMGFGCIAIANAHLEPEHLSVLHLAQNNLGEKIIFPDITKRIYSSLLTDEFRKGECHAGQFETSLVMCDALELVHEGIRDALDDVPISLSKEIREGKKSFHEMGSTQAYFGSPRLASREEGEESFRVLAKMIVDEVERFLKLNNGVF